jgi:fluoride ion exporter CrcB/FEX
MHPRGVEDPFDESGAREATGDNLKDQASRSTPWGMAWINSVGTMILRRG